MNAANCLVSRGVPLSAELPWRVMERYVVEYKAISFLDLSSDVPLISFCGPQIFLLLRVNVSEAFRLS